jgi:hypothetical protein
MLIHPWARADQPVGHIVAAYGTQGSPIHRCPTADGTIAKDSNVALGVTIFWRSRKIASKIAESEFVPPQGSELLAA